MPLRRSSPVCLTLFAWAGLLVLPACVITPDGVQEKPIVLEEVFPPSKSVSSYRQLAKPKRADSETLAAQMGGADRVDEIKRWGAFASVGCDYGLPDQPPRVRVTVSELRSKLDAYGAYTQVRPGMLPENQYVRIGAQGALEDDRLLFVHDRYLVAVRDLQPTEAEPRRTLLINFARAVSSRIPRPITEIDPALFLPLQGRVAGSERLFREDPLGLKIFEKGGVTALYRCEEREGRVFIAYSGETGSRRAHFEKLRKVMEQSGAVADLKIGEFGCQGQFRGQPALAAQSKGLVFGVFGALTPDEMREMMAYMDRRIRPLTPIRFEDMKKEKEKEEAKETGGPK